MTVARSVRLLTATAAAALVLTACGSSTGAKRTVTVMETHTSGAASAPASSPAVTASSIVVGPSSGAATDASAAPSASADPSAAPSGSDTAASPAESTGATDVSSSAAASTTAASTDASSTTETAETSEATEKVNALAVDCGTLLSANDVKKVTGVAIPAATNRIKDVANPKVNSTGSIRCLYGVSDKDNLVSLRITQYKTADAATKQIGVTVSSETERGAKASTATVAGQKANILIRDGGLINVQYADWTLAIAVDKTVLKSNEAAALTQLAEMAMTRAIKAG